MGIDQRGASPGEYYFKIGRSRITENLNLNPVRYVPRYSESRRLGLEMGERPGWSVERLGQIAQVFNGPRFKRPYPDKGVISGPVGRPVYATSYHDGAVGTNNLIRIVTKDDALRGYLYQILSSKLGWDQLKRTSIRRSSTHRAGRGEVRAGTGPDRRQHSSAGWTSGDPQH